MEARDANRAVREAIEREKLDGTPAGFGIEALRVVHYVSGFTMWHYRAPHLTFREIMAPGHFDACAGELANGDIIIVAASSGTDMLTISSADDRTVAVRRLGQAA